jgi:hypothetical protein
MLKRLGPPAEEREVEKAPPTELTTVAFRQLLRGSGERHAASRHAAFVAQLLNSAGKSSAGVCCDSDRACERMAQFGYHA